MFPWSSEVVSDSKQLAFPGGKKGKTKTVPCPLGFKSVPRGSTRGKQTIHLMPDIFSEKSLLYLLPITSNTACYWLLLCVTAYYGLLLACFSLLCVKACYWLLPFPTVSLACTTDDIGGLRAACKLPVSAPLTPVV